MRESLHERVGVVATFPRRDDPPMPRKLVWEGREHTITKLGLHHSYRQGRVTWHVFSVSDGMTFFRLALNTETLEWFLEEIHDGYAD